MKAQRVSHLEYLCAGYPVARSQVPADPGCGSLRVNTPAQTSVRLLDPVGPQVHTRGAGRGPLAGSVFEMGVCGGQEVKPRLLRLVMA